MDREAEAEESESLDSGTLLVLMSFLEGPLDLGLGLLDSLRRSLPRAKWDHFYAGLNQNQKDNLALVRLNELSEIESWSEVLAMDDSKWNLIVSEVFHSGNGAVIDMTGASGQFNAKQFAIRKVSSVLVHNALALLSLMHVLRSIQRGHLRDRKSMDALINNRGYLPGQCIDGAEMQRIINFAVRHSAAFPLPLPSSKRPSLSGAIDEVTRSSVDSTTTAVASSSTRQPGTGELSKRYTWNGFCTKCKCALHNLAKDLENRCSPLASVAALAGPRYFPAHNITSATAVDSTMSSSKAVVSTVVSKSSDSSATAKRASAVTCASMTMTSSNPRTEDSSHIANDSDTRVALAPTLLSEAAELTTTTVPALERDSQQTMTDSSGMSQSQRLALMTQTDADLHALSYSVSDSEEENHCNEGDDGNEEEMTDDKRSSNTKDKEEEEEEEDVVIAVEEEDDVEDEQSVNEQTEESARQRLSSDGPFAAGISNDNDDDDDASVVRVTAPVSDTGVTRTDGRHTVDIPLTAVHSDSGHHSAHVPTDPRLSHSRRSRRRHERSSTSATKQREAEAVLSPLQSAESSGDGDDKTGIVDMKYIAEIKERHSSAECEVVDLVSSSSNNSTPTVRSMDEETAAVSNNCVPATGSGSIQRRKRRTASPAIIQTDTRVEPQPVIGAVTVTDVAMADASSATMTMPSTASMRSTMAPLTTTTVSHRTSGVRPPKLSPKREYGGVDFQMKGLMAAEMVKVKRQEEDCRRIEAVLQQIGGDTTAFAAFMSEPGMERFRELAVDGCGLDCLEDAYCATFEDLLADGMRRGKARAFQRKLHRFLVASFETLQFAGTSVTAAISSSTASKKKSKVGGIAEDELAESSSAIAANEWSSPIAAKDASNRKHDRITTISSTDAALIRRKRDDARGNDEEEDTVASAKEQKRSNTSASESGSLRLSSTSTESLAGMRVVETGDAYRSSEDNSMGAALLLAVADSNDDVSTPEMADEPPLRQRARKVQRQKRPTRKRKRAEMDDDDTVDAEDIGSAKVKGKKEKAARSSAKHRPKKRGRGSRERDKEAIELQSSSSSGEDAEEAAEKRGSTTKRLRRSVVKRPTRGRLLETASLRTPKRAASGKEERDATSEDGSSRAVQRVAEEDEDVDMEEISSRASSSGSILKRRSERIAKRKKEDAKTKKKRKTKIKNEEYDENPLLEVGDSGKVLWHQHWFEAHVMAVKKRRRGKEVRYEVEYDGYESEWDETLSHSKDAKRLKRMFDNKREALALDSSLTETEDDSGKENVTNTTQESSSYRPSTARSNDSDDDVTNSDSSVVYSAELSDIDNAAITKSSSKKRKNGGKKRGAAKLKKRVIRKIGVRRSRRLRRPKDDAKKDGAIAASRKRRGARHSSESGSDGESGDGFGNGSGLDSVWDKSHIVDQSLLQRPAETVLKRKPQLLKKAKGKRKGRGVRWTEDELDAFYDALDKHYVAISDTTRAGVKGVWATIRDDPEFADRLSQRSNLNLKDKFRGLRSKRDARVVALLESD